MKKISILMAVVVSMALVAGVASAAKQKTVKVDSEITLKFKGQNGSGDYYEEGNFFSGKVSAKKDCQEDRKVQVFAKSGGRVGKDVTNKQGRYSIEAGNVGNGKYVAEVKKKTYEQGNKLIVCGAATSDKVTVG